MSPATCIIDLISVYFHQNKMSHDEKLSKPTIEGNKVESELEIHYAGQTTIWL